ncbi:MAG TPA: hypothetical protein DCY35_08365 [Prolixibacteraceae bacterium]|nr:hypothetical protein [Prolixibacteraceae bacterium]
MNFHSFKNTAEKDRYYICEIGRLIWGDNKQCYSADAVYAAIKNKLRVIDPERNPEQSPDNSDKPLPVSELSNLGEHSKPCELELKV